MSEQRFVKVYNQGFSNQFEVFTDQETGVQYLSHVIGGVGCAICPLLDADGKPMIDPQCNKKPKFSY